ncbi:site-2 protease family protein [Patescibacteria group bacterium]|nr:site-2 protease family protein [Patescibacteria group bacterium]
MEIIIFLIVIIVLILVHELGHFIVAKLSGMRVDEFGIGYPPRALTIGKVGETEYTLNWLPFGGFVRIYGEDAVTEEAVAGEAVDKETNESTRGSGASSRAFSSKPRILQALTLIAGIVMNLLFAYILLTTTLVIGTLQPLSPEQIPQVKDATIAFTDVRPGSPADKAGFMAGDEIKSASIITKTFAETYDGNNPEGLTTLISTDTQGDPMKFIVDRNGKMLTIMATPVAGAITSAPRRPGLGVVVTAIGTIKVPLKDAFTQGAHFTWEATRATAIGLFDFFKSIFTFKANLAQVTGPIGIANAVGHASMNGIAALLSLTALISINLALINLLPIPALDGGRLLFVIIEGIIRRPLNPKIAERVNMVGFAFLILLMIVVSGHDIFNLLHK